MELWLTLPWLGAGIWSAVQCRAWEDPNPFFLVLVVLLGPVAAAIVALNG